ncbi:MAG: transcription elongation factor GreAB [Myxococcota bacterium]
MNTDSPDKSALRDAVLALLAHDAAEMKAAADTTRQGAVHEESRSEHDKDTRSLEASYLARGQAERTVAIGATMTRMRVMPLVDFDEDDPVALSALVDVRVDDEPRRLFVVSEGGGLRVRFEGVEVLLITTASPVGKALLGRVAGDEFTLVVGGKARAYIIERVR